MAQELARRIWKLRRAVETELSGVPAWLETVEVEEGEWRGLVEVFLLAGGATRRAFVWEDEDESGEARIHVVAEGGSIYGPADAVRTSLSATVPSHSG